MQKNKTTRKKRKSGKKKPKFHPSSFKIIVFCGAVVAVCLLLLICTSVLSKPKTEHRQEAPISGRFEQKPPEHAQNSVKESKKQENPAPQPQKKTEPAQKQKPKEPEKKAAADTKPQQPQPEKRTPPARQDTAEKQKPAAPAQNPQNPQKNVNPTPKPDNTAARAKPAQQAPAKTAKKEEFGFPQARNGAQLIFVFDDGGQNLAHLAEFLKLPFPFTVAVLPQLAHSSETAAKVRASGNEVILHQPMQAVNANVNPGPGAITPQMTTAQIEGTLIRNIQEIGPVAGMNNHEGSLITADAQKMSVVLRIASAEGIYFLDSRTNADTKVPEVSEALGYSYFARNVFLDNEKKRAPILAEIKKGIDIANKNGTAIMIGHIWSADILPGILREIYPELKAKGYRFSTVSESDARIYP